MKFTDELKSFWPKYVSEHRNAVSRRLHFLGTGSALVGLGVICVLQAWKWVWLLLIFGYGPAWVGHFVFEKNRPATFKHPLKSLICDFVMFYKMLTGSMW
jgi:hypothetical protein